MLTSFAFNNRSDSVGRVLPQEIDPKKLFQKEENELFDSNQITIHSDLSSNLSENFDGVYSKGGTRKRKGSQRSEESSEFEFLNQQSKAYERKYRVYNFFNKPKTFWSIVYHILVFILVFGCLIATVFSTIHIFAAKASEYLLILEKIIIIWFISEFMLRLWSSSCKQRYQGWKGKLKYVIVWSHLLDIAVIILSIVVMTLNTRSGSEVFAVSAFRGFHRFFNVFQILTLNRHIEPWKLLFAVICDQCHQLLIIIYIEFVMVCILGYVSYIIEKDDNKQFNNIAEAMWGAVRVCNL
jgi:potassium voltage-gated channel KQT-like subfamily protein